MNKTQRHAGQVAKMLSSVDGDIDKLKKNMLEQRDVTNAASLATESWAASWDKLKNSFQLFASVGVTETLEALIPLIHGATNALGALSSFANETPGVGIATTVASISAAAATFMKLKLNPLKMMELSVSIQQTAKASLDFAKSSANAGSKTIEYAENLSKLANKQAKFLASTGKVVSFFTG